jgi:hypothetical protein
MGKILFFLLLVFWFLDIPTGYCQEAVRLSDPRLEIRDNILHITYDFLNSVPSDSFRVSVSIFDENGNRFDAKSLAGDLGKNVSGGLNKRVTWDLGADHIFINAYVYVKIYATQISIEPESLAGVKDEEVSQPLEDSAHGVPPAPYMKSPNRTALVAQSLAWPGLGLSRVTGKPHWIRGAVGYGCVAGSVVLNRYASARFQKIPEMDDSQEAIDVFHSTVVQDQVSEALIYVAAGVWITDIVWTLISTSPRGDTALQGSTANLSIRGHYDPRFNIPVLGFIYNF